jgi:hypothetical protein
MDTFRDLLYFATVSFTTVGYGDMSPKSNRAKLLVSLFILTTHMLILYGIYTAFDGE